MRLAFDTACSRCGERPATTRITWRNGGTYPTTSERCDRCAADLREYLALPGMNGEIVTDEPIEGLGAA